jgi:glycerol-3-phosphate dehydrogenase (NAD(P)+)
VCKVAVIGDTSWGNTLANLLATVGATVSVWTRTDSRAVERKKEARNDHDGRLCFTGRIEEALSTAEFVVLAVPAQRMRQNVKFSASYLSSSATVISVAKGLEVGTSKRMSEVIADEVSAISQDRICALSGPNLSAEINQGLPAVSVVACPDLNVAGEVQELLDSPAFTVFISDDIVGVEICGALKNVIAVGAGIMDGLELGNNAKAAFIALGWSDVVSLGTALGARPETFYGLAGLGDLIATGNSPLSRNHYVGCELGKGRLLKDIMKSMSQVAEGVDTAMAAHQLAISANVEVPFVNLVYSVLFESLPPAEISKRIKDGLKPGSIA